MEEKQLSKLQFQLLMPYLNRPFYGGRFIRWMISDKQGKNVYCAFCGNYANGVGYKKVGHFTFDLPICKRHIQQLNPSVQQAPFYAKLI
jgi:uncharacterized Fe-S cluster-containing radical SAM superfamily protein